MTATTVGGLAVITHEPTDSGLKTTTGTPVTWKQVRTLLLEDGTTTYGCVHCDYTADSPHRVRPHLNKHRERPERPPAASELTLSDLLAKVERLNEVEAERDHWKARAIKAEKAMTTLRRALNGD